MLFSVFCSIQNLLHTYCRLTLQHTKSSDDRLSRPLVSCLSFILFQCLAGPRIDRRTVTRGIWVSNFRHDAVCFTRSFWFELLSWFWVTSEVDGADHHYRCTSRVDPMILSATFWYGALSSTKVPDCLSLTHSTVNPICFSFAAAWFVCLNVLNVFVICLARWLKTNCPRPSRHSNSIRQKKVFVDWWC